MTKWYINVNQHKIRNNIGAENPEPVISIRRGISGKSRYVDSCTIPDGSRLVYRSEEPILSCGARLVIECPSEPIVDG